jgi:hypothetical protein
MIDTISQYPQKLLGAGAILVSMLTIFQRLQGPTEIKLDTSELDPKPLLETPIPRAVVMGWPIKVQMAVAALFFFLIFTVWASDAVGPDKNANFLERFGPIFALFLLFVVVSFAVIQELRHRWLLRYGKCVQGRVVDRIKATGGMRRSSFIVYQFAVGPGKPMTAKGGDYTHSLSRNSKVLVFFDPDRLENNVAICSTGWRICGENGRIIEP